MSKKMNKENRKKDMGKIATRIMAAVLALLMVVGFAATLIFYLIPA